MTARLNERLYALIAATRFPRVRDADAMLDWIAYVRIAIGLVAFVRVALIAESSRFYFDGGSSWTGLINAHETELALFELALLALLIVGLATPLVLAALIATVDRIDLSLGTATLGSDVFLLVLVFLLLAGAGTRLSLDALLGRRVRFLYPLGTADARQLTIYLFGLFAGYALISFGALTHHLADVYWQHGDTISVMFASSYLSRAWPVARELQEWWAWPFGAFSRVAGIGQTVFQLAMLVLVRWRWGLTFVIVWGGLFVLVSALVLRLSYLPFVEICLWGLLWVRPREQAAIAILYDDRCNLCRGTVRTLRALDPLRAFAFLPLSEHGETAERHGASAEAILEDLHGIRDGRVLRGYDLYRVLARVNPLLWVFVPVLELGRLTRIGPLVYRAVAVRRRRLFGTCELGGAPAPRAAVPAPRQRPAVTAVATGALTLLALSLVLTLAPLQGLWESLGVRPWPQALETASADARRVVGFVEPDVFNITDLRMGEQWWTATFVTADGRRGEVPLNDEHGSRARYHWSDVLYFGNSLLWRRGAIGGDLEALNAQAGPLRPLIERALVYDRRRRGGAGPVQYTVRLYRDRSADVTLPYRERYRARAAGGFDVQIG